MALNRSDKSRILRRYFPGMTRNSEMSTEPSVGGFFTIDRQLRCTETPRHSVPSYCRFPRLCRLKCVKSRFVVGAFLIKQFGFGFPIEPAAVKWPVGMAHEAAFLIRLISFE